MSKGFQFSWIGQPGSSMVKVCFLGNELVLRVQLKKECPCLCPLSFPNLLHAPTACLGLISSSFGTSVCSPKTGSREQTQQAGYSSTVMITQIALWRGSVPDRVFGREAAGFCRQMQKEEDLCKWEGRGGPFPFRSRALAWLSFPQSYTFASTKQWFLFFFVPARQGVVKTTWGNSFHVTSACALAFNA